MWGAGVTEKVPNWKGKAADTHYAYDQSIFTGSHCPLWNNIQIPNTCCLVLPLPLISVPIHILGTHLRTSLVGMYDRGGASSPISSSLRKEM